MKHLFVRLHREDGTFSGSVSSQPRIPYPAVASSLNSSIPPNGRTSRAASPWIRPPCHCDPSAPDGKPSSSTPPLSVFDDALPDDWGRRLLARSLKLDGRSASPAEMLLRMEGGGTGALMLTEKPTLPEKAATTLVATHLSTLLTAAAKFENGALEPGDAFRELLEGSSRAGGARPKALVHDDTGEWLAKFPSKTRDGSHDVVGLEATCLELARRSGLVVPDSRLQPIGRRRVLLVRRFDITPFGGRVHMVSLKTLCKERPGVYVEDYSSIARILEKYSATPAADVSALYRHMVFNAAIGNVDDHLKNFWMLRRTSGYRLAPSFDLVPDVSGRMEHTLSFQHEFGCPTRAEFRELANQWHVPEATAILDEVVRAVRSFPALARKHEMRNSPSLDTVRQDIRRRWH
jgi:serine/threonine-protein kinase HipA